MRLVDLDSTLFIAALITAVTASALPGNLPVPPEVDYAPRCDVSTKSPLVSDVYGAANAIDNIGQLCGNTNSDGNTRIAHYGKERRFHSICRYRISLICL
jgi:hypothetical protein